MKVWIGERVDGKARYRVAELPRPQAREGEVLVRVRAAGINRVDQFPKAGHFQHSEAPPAAIPGLEAAGEVVEVAGGDGSLKVGDGVMAMVQGGCAEYVRVPQPLAMRVPDALDWAQASCVPVSCVTAHDALYTAGRLPAGGSVLIHAITSGVGLAALRIARLRGAGFIAGSSGSPDKLARAKQDGMDLGLADVYGADGFAKAVMAATGGRGVDVVLDHIGGTILNETVRATALGGRVIDIGRFGGVRAEIDLDLLAVRRVSLVGVTFRTRSLAEHAAAVTAFMDDMGADLAASRLTPVLDRTYPFAELPEAIAHATSRGQYGKLALLF